MKGKKENKKNENYRLETLDSCLFMWDYCNEKQKENSAHKNVNHESVRDSVEKQKESSEYKKL